jgi:hypothetical protein
MAPSSDSATGLSFTANLLQIHLSGVLSAEFGDGVNQC